MSLPRAVWLLPAHQVVLTILLHSAAGALPGVLPAARAVCVLPSRGPSPKAADVEVHPLTQPTPPEMEVSPVLTREETPWRRATVSSGFTFPLIKVGQCHAAESPEQGQAVWP